MGDLVEKTEQPKKIRRYRIVRDWVGRYYFILIPTRCWPKDCSSY